MTTSRKRQSGFSLFEITVLLVVISVATLSTASGILSAQKATNSTRRERELLSLADGLLGRMRSLSVGTGGAATALQITDIVARDGASSGVPAPSLSELRGASPMAWQYAGSDAAAMGTWTILIDSDLNGDGDTLDPLEGTDEVLRIAISFDGRLLVEGVRSRDPNE